MKINQTRRRQLVSIKGNNTEQKTQMNLFKTYLRLQI